MYKIYLVISLCVLFSCQGNNTSSKDQAASCFSFTNDFLKLHVSSFSSLRRSEGIQSKMRPFLVKAHHLFQEKQLPVNYETVWIDFLEKQLLVHPSANHLDTAGLQNYLRQLKLHSDQTPICDRLYLFHQIVMLLSSNVLLNTQSDFIELELLHTDTLQLSPNQTYRFPYYLKYHYSKGNVFWLNKIKAINKDTSPIDYERLTINTPTLSDTTILDTIHFMLENDLTKEHYERYFVVPIQLDEY